MTQPCPHCAAFRARAEEAEEALRQALERPESGLASSVSMAFRLSPQQGRIVARLVRSPGVVSLPALRQETKDDPKMLRVVLHQIRRRAPWLAVINVHGVGYALTPEARGEAMRRLQGLACVGPGVASRGVSLGAAE